MIEAGNAEALEGFIAQSPATARQLAHGPEEVNLTIGGCSTPPSSTCRRSRRPAAGRLPGSKSISNRVLLLAALCDGTTMVHDLLDSDDTRVMLDALRALGCAVVHRGAAVVITGFGGRRPARRPAVPGQRRHGDAAARTAALALLGGDFELSGVPRMHERPIGDLVDALRQLGCRIDYLGQPGFRRCAWAPRAPAARRRSRSGARRRLQPVPHRAADGLPLVATRDVVIDVVGELISKPYIEITLNLLARFGIAVRATAGSASPFRPAAATARPATSTSRPMPRRPATSPRWAPSPAHPLDARVRIEGVGARLDPGRHPLRRSRAAPWAPRSERPELDRGVRARRLAAEGDRPRLQPHPRRRHDAGRDGAVRRRPEHAAQHRQLARQGNRPLAAMAAELRKLGARWRKARTSCASRRRPDWRAASIHTYDDHRVAMCFSLAAFNPAGRAGAHPRPEVRGQDLPRLLRDPVRRRPRCRRPASR
jgi:3-phosphoshikimate 1-carboxyvinyltransferase